MDYPELDGFESLDNDEQAKTVYAHFGLSIYFAQILEQQAINMIVVQKQTSQTLTKIDVESLWDNYDKGTRTFGILLNEIKHCYNLSEDDYNELKRILKLRNYMTHDYFRFNIELFYSISGMKRVIQDFIDFKRSVQAIDSKLNAYLEVYYKKIGLTQEIIREIIDKSKSEWEKKVIDENHITIIK